MRYARIFLLHFQEAFALRSRSVVWFLIAVMNPLVIFLFWSGAYADNGAIFPQWSISSVATYYFLLVIASSLLIVHIEEDIARWDIQQGGLSRYILKPFSYAQLKFFEELPWRLIQGFFGMVIFAGFWFLLGGFGTLVHDPLGIALTILIAVCAYMISFLFKMIVGLSALWITDYSGLQQLVEVVILTFAGMLMPIEFFPDAVQRVAYALPFPYIIYFPIIALQGKLTAVQSVQTLAIQAAWIILFALLYCVIWKKGMKLFTGIGQ